MNKKTVCFVAGKSGGHIIPCLTLAQKYKTNTQEIDFLFFSSSTPLDKLIISSHPLISHHVMLPLVTIYPAYFLERFVIVWKIITSCLLSFFYLYKHKPTEVITTGGVLALPVCLSAFILRIPIVLYSLDAVPGKAICALAPFANRIVICFKHSEKFFPSTKCTVSSFPIRYTEPDKITKEAALKRIHFTPDKKTLLILGGSQGSLFLNDCIKQWITTSDRVRSDVNIIHQTGSSDETNWQQFYEQHNVTAHIFSYLHDLSAMYSAADLIICRAGAGTLFEIEFFKKRCLVIPLKTHTTTHQIDNARTIAHEYPHLFQWISQDAIETEPTHFFSKINKLLFN